MALSVPVQREIGRQLAEVLQRARDRHGATGADCVQFLFAVAYAEASKLGQSTEQIATWAVRAFSAFDRSFKVGRFAELFQGVDPEQKG